MGEFPIDVGDFAARHLDLPIGTCLDFRSSARHCESIIGSLRFKVTITPSGANNCRNVVARYDMTRTPLATMKGVCSHTFFVVRAYAQLIAGFPILEVTILRLGGQRERIQVRKTGSETTKQLQNDIVFRYWSFQV